MMPPCVDEMKEGGSYHHGLLRWRFRARLGSRPHIILVRSRKDQSRPGRRSGVRGVFFAAPEMTHALP